VTGGGGQLDDLLRLDGGAEGQAERDSYEGVAEITTIHVCLL
jgi:hypothetical protein